MTDKNIEQFRKLLEPIHKNLAEINKKLGEQDKNFETINKKLDQHTGALINIEDTIKMYGDMYQINNDNAKKLEKRIDVLEDKGRVVAPPELRLANF